MKKIVKAGIIIVSSIIGLFLLFLVISVIAEYKPPLRTPLENLSAGTGEKVLPPATFTVLTWNIGYAGLDEKADFVIDGGKKSIAESKKTVLLNMEEIVKELTGIDADYYFLQEVDRPSNRSYFINEVEMILDSFPSYSGWFAKNFDVLFIPYPVLKPIGYVQSGLLTLGRYLDRSCTRISLPGLYNWPVRLFHLKRCMSVLWLRGPVPQKNLYLINLHLEAYDRQGEIRAQQLAFIKDILNKLFELGHYVIAGGDWNALFPGITKASFSPFSTEEKDLFWLQKIPDDWTPAGWQWAFEPVIPTCRSLEAPYEKGENFTTIIDGFIVSPNIEILDVKGFDLGFRHSDHNPVLLKVMLKVEEEQK